MTEIRKLWRSEFPPIPEEELALLSGAVGGTLAEAACCFWLFRILHRVKSPTAVLMGDYCFGRFSNHLAAMDHVELTRAFAAYLRKDTLREAGIGEYIEFIKTLSRMI